MMAPKLLRSVLDATPDLIFYKDQDSVYLGCNRAFEAFANHRESEIIGRTDFDFFDSQADFPTGGLHANGVALLFTQKGATNG